MIVIMRPAGRLACSTACDSIYSCSLSAGAIVVWAPGWDGVEWYGMVWYGLRICICLVHGVFIHK